MCECGHKKEFHKPSQYYEGTDCHKFIGKGELDYTRCSCKKFIKEVKNGRTRRND